MHSNPTPAIAMLADIPCAISSAAAAAASPARPNTPSTTAPIADTVIAISNRNARWASAATRSATSAAPARSPENSSGLVLADLLAGQVHLLKLLGQRRLFVGGVGQFLRQLALGGRRVRVLLPGRLDGRLRLLANRVLLLLELIRVLRHPFRRGRGRARDLIHRLMSSLGDTVDGRRGIAGRLLGDIVHHLVCLTGLAFH